MLSCLLVERPYHPIVSRVAKMSNKGEQERGEHKVKEQSAI